MIRSNPEEIYIRGTWYMMTIFMAMLLLTILVQCTQSAHAAEPERKCQVAASMFDMVENIATFENLHSYDQFLTALKTHGEFDGETAQTIKRFAEVYYNSVIPPWETDEIKKLAKADGRITKAELSQFTLRVCINNIPGVIRHKQTKDIET